MINVNSILQRIMIKLLVNNILIVLKTTHMIKLLINLYPSLVIDVNWTVLLDNMYQFLKILLQLIHLKHVRRK